MQGADLWTALAPSLLIIAGALLIGHRLDPRKNLHRVAVLALAAALMGRYAVWRAAETLPPFAWSLETLWTHAFYLVELGAIVGIAVSFLILSRTRDRSREATQHAGWWRNSNGSRSAAPRVDVFIATYNEPEEVLAPAIVGAQAIDYPDFQVWVLDDGCRDWVRELADAEGAGYLAREDSRHAKAGNLNHGLEYLREAGIRPDFIAVLDADFVPHREFLDRTLALFHRPDVGLVQTPQHFFNPDPMQSNLLASDVWPDEQRFFFDIVMPSRDAWDIAFCCGTSSLIRYAALEAIDGFPTESITEDYLLSLKLRDRGWHTVYLNERLSLGLAPEGLREYITQRGRWCIGLMQILRTRHGPVQRHNLPLMDRIGLFDAFMYWSNSFLFRGFCFLVPIAYWFLGWDVIQTTIKDIIYYFAPYFVSQSIAIAWISRYRVLPVVTEAGQLIATFAALKGTIVGLVGEKTQKFEVTAKGGLRHRLTIQWNLARRFALVAILTMLGVLYALGAEYAPYYDEGGRFINTFWSLYNITILAITIIVCIELPRYRRSERFATSEEVQLIRGNESYDYRLADISLHGARIKGTPPTLTGQHLELRIDGVGDVPVRVRRAGGDWFSVEFELTREIHDRLVQKLFSGAYNPSVQEGSPFHVVRAVARRLFG